MTSYLLCFLSAFFLFLAYPPADWGLFAWIAFVPFFIALENRRLGEKILFGFLTGFLFFFPSLFWLRHVTWVGTFSLSLYLALYFAAFSVLSGRPLLLAAGWVTLEFVRAHLLSGFGWNLLGFSQWHATRLIQIADTTGAYGISFLVMAVNAALFFAYKKKSLLPLALAVLLLSAAFVYGTLVLRRGLPSTEIRVAVVQGNIPQSLKWDSSIRELIWSKYERLTQRVCLNHPEIVFWPETSVPGVLPEEKDLLIRLEKLAQKEKVFLLVGSAYRLEEGITNSALLITPQGGRIQRYDKLHLVPYGEYIPFEKQFPFLRNWIVTGDFIPGKSATVFNLPQGNFSVLICFEDVFPDLSRRFVQNGAQALAVITNDAWFRRSAAPYQHAQASVFRAVENRVPIVRAANTGLSCTIDPFGRIQETIADEKGESIEVTGSKSFLFPFPANVRQTFYTRHGDLFAVSCAVSVLAACLFGTGRMKKKNR